MCGIMGYFRKGAGNDERLGAFCCLAVTATEMGLVKDAYAFKPLVVAETNDFVAVATKEIAIRSAIPGNYKYRKPRWRRCCVRFAGSVGYYCGGLIDGAEIQVEGSHGNN